MRSALVLLVGLILFSSLSTTGSLAPFDPSEDAPATWRMAHAPLESVLVNCRESLAPRLPVRSRWAGHLFGRARGTTMIVMTTVAQQPAWRPPSARTLQMDDVRLQV